MECVAVFNGSVLREVVLGGGGDSSASGEARKDGFATTFCDLARRKVHGVVLGRSEASLEGYLSRLKGKDRVEVVCMDLSSTYRAIVKNHFPRARAHPIRTHDFAQMHHEDLGDSKTRLTGGLTNILFCWLFTCNPLMPPDLHPPKLFRAREAFVGVSKPPHRKDCLENFVLADSMFVYLVFCFKLAGEGKLTGKVVRVWSLLLVIAVAWLIGSAGYERLAGSPAGVRYLVLSARPESLDSSIKNASLLGARVTYARQDSEFGSSLLNNLKLAQPPALVLVINGGDPTVTTETDPAKISAQLDAAIPSNKSTIPGFAIAALAGLWLGVFLSRHVYRHASWALAVGAGSAWWKWTHQCPTCPALTIAGVDAAFLGFLLLSALALAAVFRRSGEGHAWLVAGACLIATWQGGAVLSSASVDCFPCALVGAVNFALVGATLFGRTTYPVEATKPRYTAAALVSSLAGFAVFTALAVPGSLEAAVVVRGATPSGPRSALARGQRQGPGDRDQGEVNGAGAHVCWERHLPALCEGKGIPAHPNEGAVSLSRTSPTRTDESECLRRHHVPARDVYPHPNLPGRFADRNCALVRVGLDRRRAVD